MSFRAELRKRVEKKRNEISSLEIKLREAQVYAQALEDTLRLLPPDDEGDEIDDPIAAAAVKELREGSMIARAREAISKAGRPLHVTELLAALSKPGDKDTRSALSGSLAAYVRKNEIFTRPAPNTFGLIEMIKNSPSRPAPPPAFGLESAAAVPDDDVPF